jgi:hypothetical protein
MYLPSPFILVYYPMRVSKPVERRMSVPFVKTLLSFSLEPAGERARKTPARVSDLLIQNPDKKEAPNETLPAGQP